LVGLVPHVRPATDLLPVGAVSVAALLMVGTITGILLALLMNNGGAGQRESSSKPAPMAARLRRPQASVVGDAIVTVQDTAGRRCTCLLNCSARLHSSPRRCLSKIRVVIPRVLLLLLVMGPLLLHAQNRKGKLSSDSLRDRAAARIATGDRNLALADLNQALQINPDDAQAWRLRAETNLALGDAKQAAMDFTRCIELKLVHAAVYLDGPPPGARRSRTKGVADYASAIKLRLDDFEPYCQRADLYLALEHEQDAIDDPIASSVPATTPPAI
jgi:hypothetical protein